MARTEKAEELENQIWEALPHKFRFPIKERFGPRVPDIFSNSQVMDAVLEKAGNRLHANINHELEYELGKLK